MVKVKRQPVRSNLSEKAVKKPAAPKKKEPEYELYQKWVRSKGFKQLRLIMLERDNYRCKFCGRTQEEIEGSKITLQAHHSQYRHVGLGDERELEDLITCCSVCHKNCHSAKSNLRRFTDKTAIFDNIKENPQLECKIKSEDLQ